MKDSEPRSAPPIPPRRLKRKNKPSVVKTEELAEAATTSGIRSEPRPRLPPPPPPQRVLPRRGIRPQLLPPTEFAAKISPAIRSAEKCHSRSINGDKLVAGDVEEVQTSFSTFGTNARLFGPARGSGKKSLTEERSSRRGEKAKIHRPNEYPPLFFTLQDFQEVMSDVENSYSRNLKNMTTFEPTPKPRTSKISVKDLPETPEKGEDVLFRVTTTNVPFEKSISEWGDVREDPNHFIFEEYVDRRQIPRSKSRATSTRLVLFGDDTFDREDNDDESTSTSRTAPRVRFLVDSPVRGEDVERITETDSLQNIDSLPLDCFPSRQDETEEEDEFGDVPFDSLLNASSEPPALLCVDPSEDSTSSKTDFQTILVTATVEPVPSVRGVENASENGGVGVGPCVDEKANSREEDFRDEPKSPRFAEVIERREERREIAVEESLRDFTGAGDRADKSAAENVRRNSFLMDMLQGDDEPDERIVCEVVAAHPKTPIHGSGVDAAGEEGEPNDAVEAKSKLLGELSSSFSAIRLKPVNNVGKVEEKQSASDLKVDSTDVGGAENRDDDDEDDENYKKYKLNRNLDSVLDSNVVKCKVSEEPIEESSSSVSEYRDRSSVCSQKTDEIIDKKYVDSTDNSVCDEVMKMEIFRDEERKVNGDVNEESENAEESNDSDDDDGKKYGSVNMTKSNEKNVVEVASISSVDKCAIVLKCNNNNDNNAMTPVDVSYDQSQNNVSIIPGSVRSFVKFYEIQGETSVGLSSNDAATAAAAAAVPKMKVEATGNTADRYREIINSKNIVSRGTGLEIENDIKYTIVARKPAIRKQGDSNQRQDKSYKSSETEVSEPRKIPVKLCKTDGEKERQLPSGSTLVRSEREETGTERSTGPGCESSAMKKVNAVAAPGIARGTQDGSTAAGIKDVVRSGTTNHSVPKSSTSTINEQYTFYCTV